MYHQSPVKFFVLAIVLFLFTVSLRAAQSKIKVRINGISDTTIILAHYFNKSIYPDDTIYLNSKGKGVFKSQKSYPQGMYMFYMPSGKFIQFMMGEDQVFSIVTDTSNFVSDAVVKGSEENTIFFDFQKYMINKRAEIKQYSDILNSEASEAEKQAARTKIKKLGEESRELIQGIVAGHSDLFVSVFLKSTLDIDVPDPPVADTSDSEEWKYRYYKAHYFDNFNPADGRLLRTPLYEDKIMNYLEKVVFQIPDTIIKEIDPIIDGARSDSALFRYLLITLFNHYGNSNIMGFDAIQVHLAEKYYLKDAWWSSEEFLKDLQERVEILKPLTLGNTAPDVELLFVPSEHFKTAANDTALKRYPHVGRLLKLHEIPADYLVLFFWEANCSHCKVAVPKMYSIYKEQLETMGVKVIAISTLFGEDGKEKWIDFVNKHQTYDWMNAWNPYDYQYKITYDILSTPQIFILDKDKKIIGKRIGPEQVPELIRAYKEQFGK